MRVRSFSKFAARSFRLLLSYCCLQAHCIASLFKVKHNIHCGPDGGSEPCSRDGIIPAKAMYDDQRA